MEQTTSEVVAARAWPRTPVWPWRRSRRYQDPRGTDPEHLQRRPPAGIVGRPHFQHHERHSGRSPRRPPPVPPPPRGASATWRRWRARCATRYPASTAGGRGAGLSIGAAAAWRAPRRHLGRGGTACRRTASGHCSRWPICRQRSSALAGPVGELHRRGAQRAADVPAGQPDRAHA